jgi:hypothetical protein
LTDSDHDEAGPPQGFDLAGADVGRAPLDHRVTALRGPAAVSVGRTFWLTAGAVGLLVFAVAIVVSVLSASNDNARIERMKTHGIPVSVTVTGCAGNLGGSGSNGAGYTCRGTYAIGRTTYHELIGSMATFAAAGTVVRGVVDPSHEGTVVLASAVASSRASSGAYLRPALLADVLVLLVLAFFRVARRPGST